MTMQIIPSALYVTLSCLKSQPIRKVIVPSDISRKFRPNSAITFRVIMLVETHTERPTVNIY